MKLGEKKAATFTIIENIEMEMFSSEEPCVVIPTQERDEEHSSHQRNLEHPLVPGSEEDPELEVPAKPRPQAKPKPAPPAGKVAAHYVPVPGFMEEIEIEMEVLPPLKVSSSKSEEASLHKTSRLKWKGLIPRRTGLVVKDVVCLPRGHYLAQLERLIIPQGKERAALAAMGMTARITIDYSWSASQMASRLAMVFRAKFVKRQRFSFIYLQCVQGSRVLFVPDAPAEGWTGEQVLRISGHGPLYIFTHQDIPQAEPERSANVAPVVIRKTICPDSNVGCQDEDNQLGAQRQSHDLSTTEQSMPELATALRLFRQKNVDRDMQTYVQVRRRDLLHSALKWVRRPSFCFRTTPIICFRGEETDGHEGPLQEFFRLALLELKKSSVFEGRPGRLFLTYDLKALENRKYYEAGVLIGWSLAQGGPGPRCLHPALFQLMCGREASLEDFSWTDVADPEVQIRLQRLHGCTDVKLMPPSLCDWVSSCGIPGIYSAHSDEIPSIYIHLVKHYIYNRVASMISQFTDGMNSCGGLWDMVRSNWKAFVPVMTSLQQEPLTLEEFKQLFDVCYSHLDCKLRVAEEATVQHWESVLTFISNGQTDVSFEDILAFITGADHVPPLGFPRLISLRFYSQNGLPHASTCALELFLPRAVAGAVDLLAMLSRAVHEALGFTRFQREGNEDRTLLL